MTARVVVISMDVPATVTDQQLADRVHRIMCQAAHPDDTDPRQLGLTWPDAGSIGTSVHTVSGFPVTLQVHRDNQES